MLKNLFFILFGFLIGQGSMFLVQTYFVTLGLFELIGNIGIALGLLSLVQWTVDGGGIFFLSKFDQENTLEHNLFSFIVARFAIGVSFVLIVIPPLYYFDIINDIIIKVVFFSPLVALIWAFNLTGIADNRNKNKLLGPVSGLSWFISALSTLFFYEDQFLGYIIGVSYCVGLLITVIFQMIVLKINILMLIKLSSFNGFFTKIKLILGYSTAYIAAQGYARSVPILIDYSIDNVTAGMYIYAKNLTNSISQLILFSRRVEFSKLAAVVNDSFTVYKIIFAQKISLIIVLIVNLLCLTFYLLSLLFPIFIDFQEVLLYCLVLNAIQIIWVLSSSLGQVMVVKGDVKILSLVILVSCILSLTIIIMLIDRFGVYSVFIAEFSMLILQFILYYKLISSKVLLN